MEVAQGNTVQEPAKETTPEASLPSSPQETGLQETGGQQPGVQTTDVDTRSFSEKKEAVLRKARRVFLQSPDWATFFSQVIGIEGVIYRVFADPDERNEFQQSEEHAEVQKMVVALRDKKPASTKEPTRVITVRMPKSLHEFLRVEASDHNTSMNQLCISKLLLVLEKAEAAANAAAQEKLQDNLKSRSTSLPGQPTTEAGESLPEESSLSESLETEEVIAETAAVADSTSQESSFEPPATTSTHPRRERPSWE